MRTTKELLIILRDHLKNGGRLRTGLCGVVQDFLFECNCDEKQELLKYIRLHRPMRGKHFDPEHKGFPYYWSWGDRVSRLSWLNDQIKNFHPNR